MSEQSHPTIGLRFNGEKRPEIESYSLNLSDRNAPRLTLEISLPAEHPISSEAVFLSALAAVSDAFHESAKGAPRSDQDRL